MNPRLSRLLIPRITLDYIKIFTKNKIEIKIEKNNNKNYVQMFISFHTVTISIEPFNLAFRSDNKYLYIDLIVSFLVFLF